MRKFFVLASIAALIASFASVNAQGLFGFRHLKLDGVQVAAAAGALWGAFAGLVLAYILVHDFHRSRAVRVRRH